MNVRATQFWILIVGSLVISGLFAKQVQLTHAIGQQQSLLGASERAAASGPAFENAWKQLATTMYQDSSQDPALAVILKNERVVIHPNPGNAAPVQPVPASTGATPAPTVTP